MSFVSTIIGAAERVPLPDVIIRAAIHRLCSRTATRLATGNAESDAWWMARQFPHSLVTAVSDSNAQREYIEGEAAKRGLTNSRVVTSDITCSRPWRGSTASSPSRCSNT